MQKYKTNSKHVKELVKQHILDNLEGMTEEGKEIELLKKNIEALIYGHKDQRQAITEYIMGGSLLIWDTDIIEFLNSLGINPEGKEFPIFRSRNLYELLVSREIEKLIKE